MSLCDESPSSISKRSIPFLHEDSLVGDYQRDGGGWKLFVLLPRMLLFKPPRGGKVSKNALLDQFTKFAQGLGLDLLT